MSGNTYGYARVSSKDQNLDRQLDALEEFGVEADMVFADKASGKDFDRPEYRRLVESLADGDVVVIKSIDRLGRNYEEILAEWRVITKERNAAIVVLDMPLPASGLSGSQCFYSCSTSLVGGNGTVWSSSKTGYSYFRVDKAGREWYLTAA